MNKVWLTLALIMAMTFSLVGCEPKPPKYPTAIDDISAQLEDAAQGNRAIASNSHYNTVPADVSNALIPEMTVAIPGKSKPVNKRFDISVNNIDAREFFMGLVEGTPYNMVVSPEVKGNLSLHLKNVTIEQTLDAVQSAYGYGYKKTSYGFEVTAPGLETRIFTVNYINVDRKGTSETHVNSGQATDMENNNSGNLRSSSNFYQPYDKNKGATTVSSKITTNSDVNFWTELKSTLDAIVGTSEGRQVVLNPQAGLVIVRAYPKEIQAVTKYLDTTQQNINRQVILEAKILEVALGKSFQSGIDWKLLGFTQNGNTNLAGTKFSAFDNTSSDSTTHSMMTLTASAFNGNFNTVINLISTQGNVQVLSSPRVATLNNQKAVIKVGQDEFFVTDVTNTTTVTSDSTIPTQDVDLTPFFSGIALDVTPQIDNRGVVTLHIHPSVSEVKDQQKKIDLGTNQEMNLPLALSTIRETDNIVRATSGQVVVIGGLMQTRTVEDIGSIPVLGDIPFVGTAFRSTKQQSVKSELVILLRPVVVNDSSWTNDLQASEQRVKRLNRGFHVGGFPSEFGTLGEGSETLAKEPEPVIGKTDTTKSSS